MGKEIYSKCKDCDGKGRLYVPVPDTAYLIGHESHKDKKVIFMNNSGQFKKTDEEVREYGRGLARWLYCYAQGNFLDALLAEYKLLEG